ncbi:MAG TPA: IclR family transcriptional regulator [Candidatus Limnocylindrales bacterium]|nr:IclR family transcriptional regulator [Candidatus Limnocylindrales bacterium]
MRSIDRLVQVLQMLSDAESGLGVMKLAEQLGIPASTAHRLVTDLGRYNVVVQDVASKRYRLGPAVLEWGAAYRQQNTLLSVAQPHMTTLCARTTESVFLTEYVNGDAICVATAESPRPLRFFMHVGQRMPYHAAASARAILAFRPAAEAEEALKREELLKFTDTTPTTKAAVLTELARVRAAGYAVCDEEMEVGVTALSVPVRAAGAEVIASLSIVAPEHRVNAQRDTMLASLLEEAEAISAALGHVEARSGDATSPITRPALAGADA